MTPLYCCLCAPLVNTSRNISNRHYLLKFLIERGANIESGLTIVTAVGGDWNHRRRGGVFRPMNIVRTTYYVVCIVNF